MKHSDLKPLLAELGWCIPQDKGYAVARLVLSTEPPFEPASRDHVLSVLRMVPGLIDDKRNSTLTHIIALES